MDAELEKVHEYWVSPEADYWTCIPGRVCGGAKMMKEAHETVYRLQAKIDQARSHILKMTLLVSGVEFDNELDALISLLTEPP